MLSNVIAFPSRKPYPKTTEQQTELFAHVAANSPVGPGIELSSKVRMRSAAGHTPVAGRMVITGRLADVCAELNRMAALEACA